MGASAIDNCFLQGGQRPIAAGALVQPDQAFDACVAVRHVGFHWKVSLLAQNLLSA